MKPNLNSVILTALLVVVSYVQLKAADSVCGDWLPYKDEKCFKVFDGTLRTFAEAEAACAKLENAPMLPIIRSMEEQDFVANYLFKTLKKEDNFWIGSRFSANQTSYKWVDNSDLTYTNWDAKGKTNKDNHCVQIQSDERVVGKWIDEPCGRQNGVICQKMQTWSVARLQKAFLDERKQHQEALDSATKDLKKAILDEQKQHQEALDSATKDLKKAILDEQKQHQDALDSATKDLKKAILDEQKQHQDALDSATKDLKNQLESANHKIDDLKQNLVPIGFIYTQLPNKNSPSDIWSWMKWTDVTSAYAGVFFRAEGAGAETFGQVQEENSRYLTHIHNTNSCENQWDVDVVLGGWSDYITSGADASKGLCLRFFVSGGEVRPRNMAIRIWERTG